MPDDQWSWDLPQRAQSSYDPAEPVAEGSARPRRAAHIDAGDDFSRTVLLTIAGALVPGLGLIAAGRRRVGTAVLSVFVLLVVGLAVGAIADRHSLLAAAVNPRFLTLLAIGLVVLALCWVAVVVGTHLSLGGGPLRRPQRAGASLLVALLSFAVAAPMAVAARYSVDQAGLVSTVFHGQGNSNSATRPTAQPTNHRDPWKNTDRVNILLLGGDAGADRTGTRTDTVMVASIDPQTGDTTLISLPRNTGKMPFPEDSALHQYYPEGFTDGDGNNAEYFLNAMYDNVPNNVPHDVLGKTDNLGADALKLSVGEATGLKIDYYVLINLNGFRQLVDALGGITVNINTYVAIGGSTDEHIPPKSYLKPGPDQHLDGAKALWFARGRYGADDFQRMDRQRCVVNAIIDQANPGNVLTRYEAIARAGKQIVKTDVPQEALPAFVDLSMRAKSGNVRSLVFKHGQNGFSSPDPDFDLMRQRVAKALHETHDEPKKSDSPSDKGSGGNGSGGNGSGSNGSGDNSSASSEPSSGGESESPSASQSSSDTEPSSNPGDTGSASAGASSSAQSGSESTKDACAWQPDVAASAQPPR
ncbi:LCP family protein [Microlunatus soli]|uniref:Cell envelope-related function transcriptional attenuator common domain-containing protein n=1 Tax=Microlunatus soli TaxID=630515 RepID=A0A1H1TH61_9ACTN|nr:LCP family protein [Microlunatus soli]SDS59528.1 cell envelope-related function transcriptional attenuator common domain-containing protein [Microlunatus soli]